MIKIKIPGSTANLGPGFDTLSMAIDMYLHVSCKRNEISRIVNISQMYITEDPAQNLITQVISKVSKKYNKDIPLLYIEINNEIPLERGLGSSSAAIIAGIIIADFYCELKMPKEMILETAGLFENHLDNLAASLYGNLNIINGNKSIQLNTVDSVKLTVFIPENYYTNTKTSRNVLPKMIELDSVIQTIQNCSAVIIYLTTNIELNFRLFQDVIHHPCRIIPGTESVFDYNCFISGSGPCIMHIWKGDGVSVSDINWILNKTGKWKSHVLKIDKLGAQYSLINE